MDQSEYSPDGIVLVALLQLEGTLPKINELVARVLYAFDDFSAGFARLQAIGDCVERPALRLMTCFDQRFPFRVQLQDGLLSRQSISCQALFACYSSHIRFCNLSGWSCLILVRHDVIAWIKVPNLP